MKSVWTQGTFLEQDKPFEKPIVGHQTHGQGSKKTWSPVNRKKSLKILKTHGTMWVTALVAALWQCIDIFVGLLTCMWEMHSYGCEQNWFYRIWGTDDENSKVRADSRNTIDGFFSSGGRHQKKICIFVVMWSEDVQRQWNTVFATIFQKMIFQNGSRFFLSIFRWCSLDEVASRVAQACL